jgi:hypothetical protein
VRRYSSLERAARDAAVKSGFVDGEQLGRAIGDGCARFRFTGARRTLPIALGDGRQKSAASLLVVITHEHAP